MGGTIDTLLGEWLIVALTARIGHSGEILTHQLQSIPLYISTRLLTDVGVTPWRVAPLSGHSEEGLFITERYSET